MSRRRVVGWRVVALAAVLFVAVAATAWIGLFGAERGVDRFEPWRIGESGADGGVGAGQDGGVPASGEREVPDGDPGTGEVPAGGGAAQTGSSEVPTSLVYRLVDELTSAGTAPVVERDLFVEYEGINRDVIVMRGAFENTDATEFRFELRDGVWVRAGGERGVDDETR